MKKKRLILGGAILFTTIYMSILGGTVSYVLFFGSLAVPVISIAYLCYVYLQFKIYQKIDTRMLVKGREVPYYFSLTNEGKIAFISIRTFFLSEKQVVNQLKMKEEYCLLPGESIQAETTLIAKYRGEYAVGIDSVQIQDYFGLFRITYTCQSKINVKVYPRILSLESLAFEQGEEDVKQLYFTQPDFCNVPDVQTRPYIAGDSKKQMHWKLTAAKGELMVRNYTKEPQEMRILYLDLQLIPGDEMERLKMEDKEIECAIAIVRYFLLNHIDATVFFGKDKVQYKEVKTQEEFEEFYEFCATVEFKSSLELATIIDDSKKVEQQANCVILLTAMLSKQLLTLCFELKNQGRQVVILYFGDADEENLQQARVEFSLYHIVGEDGISILSKRE